MKMDLCSYFSSTVSASEQVCKKGLLVLLAGVLTGCVSLGQTKSPAVAEPQPACQLLKAEPQLRAGLVRARQHWQLEPGTALAVLEVEAGADFTLRPYGLSWDEYRISTENWQAERQQLDYALDFIGWNFKRSQQRYDFAADDIQGLYLVYRLGSADPRRLERQPQLNEKAAAVAQTAALYNEQLDACSGQLADTGWGRQWLKWMN